MPTFYGTEKYLHKSARSKRNYLITALRLSGADMSFSSAAIKCSALFLLISSGLVMSPDAFAARKKGKSKAKQDQGLVKVAKTEDSHVEDELASKTYTSRRFLVLGVNMPLDINMAVESKYDFVSGLLSNTAKVDYKVSEAPGFSLEVWNLMNGFLGVNVGGFYDPAKKIDSFKVEGNEQSVALEKSFESQFTQYGAMLSLMVAGDIPYIYAGVNYGGGKLEFKESDEKLPELRGALGGQAGLGLIIGDMIAIEGSYRLTNFTTQEEKTLAKIDRKISVVSTMINVKILLH